MPTVSRFFGIVVYMNYKDHSPPHFHARHQREEVMIDIHTGAVTGEMSRTALHMLLVWGEQHREELLANWNRARQHVPLLPIPPLT
jgi:Domain of unknown function (DUF4160)